MIKNEISYKYEKEIKYDKIFLSVYLYLFYKSEVIS